MKLSVVVPTSDRLSHLEVTLARLATQRDADFEVLVVDNAPERGAATERVASLAAGFPMPLRAVREPHPGVSAARNLGVREAAHDAVLFLNDDTAPADDLLVAAHAERLEAFGPGTAVMGRIRYTDSLLRDPFMRFLDAHAQFTYEELSPGPVTQPGRVYTAHLSIRRRDFDAAGGFDERLVFGFEDAEFAHRLLAAPVRVHYDDGLVTRHDHPMTRRQWARRAERMGAAGVVANAISDAVPPLAAVPVGVRWTAMAACARVVERLPAIPAPLRRLAYVALNQGAYARGYRRAAAGAG